MKINRTATVELDQKDIEVFTKALDHLNFITDWGDTHEDELPKSVKPLSKKAYDAYFALEEFLEWMNVDVDEIKENFELDGCA